MNVSAGKFRGLRRLADCNGRFKITAVDQRPPIVDPIARKRGAKVAPWRDVADFKKLLVEELQQESSAMLLDPNFAYPHCASVYDPAKGLILTLEDSRFEQTSHGRLSAEIDDWSVEKIKRLGGDAVKMLVWYRPDVESRICRQQKDLAARIGDACARFDIPFVFELLIYPLKNGGVGEPISQPERAELVLNSVRAFSDPRFGIDILKIESPYDPDSVPGKGNEGWKDTQQAFDALGDESKCPWVMLSAGASMHAFRNVLSQAYHAGASGYLAGRAIWLQAFESFPDWVQMRHELKSGAVNYMRDINSLTDSAATPWHRHSCYGVEGPEIMPANETFRNVYRGFD